MGFLDQPFGTQLGGDLSNDNPHAKSALADVASQRNESTNSHHVIDKLDEEDPCLDLGKRWMDDVMEYVPAYKSMYNELYHLLTLRRVFYKRASSSLHLIGRHLPSRYL